MIDQELKNDKTNETIHNINVLNSPNASQRQIFLSDNKKMFTNNLEPQSNPKIPIND